VSRLAIRNCRALIGSAQEASGPLDIMLDGRRIAAVEPAGEAVAEMAIDASGCLLAPGLINGHFHSHEHFQKGRFDNLPLELWMNYVRPPRPVPLSARQVYLRTLIGAIEALRSGTTTLVDDMNLGAALERSHLDAVFQAYEDIGIRALVGLSMMDRPFFESLPFVKEEFEPELLDELRAMPVADPTRLMALARELARLRHPSEHRVGFIAAPSAPQRCTTEFLQAVRLLADEFDLPVITHLHETRLQVVTGHLREGMSFVQYLHRIGFLRPKTSLIHGVWLTPVDIEILASSEATVQHNPWSNLRLGSGVAPMRALLEAGVNVSMGSDGCASTDTCNMLHSVALMAGLSKLRGHHAEWIGAAEALRAATLGGAVALGKDAELGTIEPGKTADLVLFRLDRVPFVPLNDPVRQLVYAERGASIDTVIVNGKVVIERGALVTIDEAAILAEIADEHAALAPSIEAAERSVDRMRPALERIHGRCACHPIPPEVFEARWA
jgi:guanine deaminase